MIIQKNIWDGFSRKMSPNFPTPNKIAPKSPEAAEGVGGSHRRSSFGFVRCWHLHPVHRGGLTGLCELIRHGGHGLVMAIQAVVDTRHGNDVKSIQLRNTRHIKSLNNNWYITMSFQRYNFLTGNTCLNLLCLTPEANY